MKIKIKIPIYFGNLIIIFTKDVKKVDEKYKLGLNGEDYPAFVKGNNNKKGVSRYYIVFDINYIDHETIAHEVTHCANWIFYDRKIKQDFLNDEPYAYLVGWVTDQIYKAADKKSVKVKTN